MESIKLNLIPSDNTKPVCHASQYDNGRSIRLELYDGDYPYILSDETIELDVKKGDGNVVTTELAFTEGNAYVDMITTEQMTAIHGQNFCELKISKDETVIYTKNFILKVEQSVLEGGIQSESEIHNLQTQIAALVEEEVDNQYDSENVIFDSVPTAGHNNGYTVTSAGLKTALDAKADASDLPDMTQYYTKTATDTLLDAKADKATTYTKTETDTALASKANAADVYTKAQVDAIADGKADAVSVYTKTEADGLLDEKADKDGEYDQLTAGLAKQIKSKVGNEDKTPYLFRTAGGSIDIGDREEDTIIGATVAFNQFYSRTDSLTYRGITFTNNNGKITISGICETGYSAYYSFAFAFIPNHVYFISGCPTGSSENTFDITVQSQSSIKLIDNKTATVFKNNNGTGLNIDVRSGYNADANPVTFIPQIIDLTQMFGSTIADYIYSLENSTAGAGVAWLKNHGFMTKPYYPYNAGELISVKTTKHITRGFNQFDEITELGIINTETGENQANNDCIRSKNYIPVLPSTSYFFKAPENGYIFYYDINKNYIGYTVSGFKNAVFNTPANAYFIRLRMVSAYGTTYKNDICINLHWDGERDGEYEPYVEHEYPLDGTKEWRGIFKLDANNKLYADGDRCPSDGQATRRYVLIDLSSKNWNAISNDRWSAGILNEAKIPETNRLRANMICSNYPALANDEMVQSGIGICISQEGTLRCRNGSTTDKPTGYLVFELATPTAETAAAYTNPQLVDDFGTEEYEDTRDIPVPVGHETMYQANLRAKLEMAPESPSGNGDYLVRQTDGQNEYVAFTKELPVAPTTDGNYRLKLTVSGGTPSLSWEEIT